MGEQATTIRICPRCHEPLPEAVYWEALPPVAGHLPAYRLRHQRRDGKGCIVYVGPVSATMAIAEGARTPPVS